MVTLPDYGISLSTACVECRGHGDVLYGDETCPVCLGSGVSLQITDDNGRGVYVYQDPRGESDNCEAYSLVCFDAVTKRVAWIEGIRKDRTHMDADIRAKVDRALAALRGGR